MPEQRKRQARKSGNVGPDQAHRDVAAARGDRGRARGGAVQGQDLFEGLKGRIDGLTHIEVGLDVSDVDYACDVVLVSEFTNSAALGAYATHPEHLRVREELGDLRIGRFQVDYPIKEETGA